MHARRYNHIQSPWIQNFFTASKEAHRTGGVKREIARSVNGSAKGECGARHTSRLSVRFAFAFVFACLALSHLWGYSPPLPRRGCFFKETGQAEVIIVVSIYLFASEFCDIYRPGNYNKENWSTGKGDHPSNNVWYFKMFALQQLKLDLLFS